MAVKTAHLHGTPASPPPPLLPQSTPLPTPTPHSGLMQNLRSQVFLHGQGHFFFPFLPKAHTDDTQQTFSCPPEEVGWLRLEHTEVREHHMSRE